MSRPRPRGRPATATSALVPAAARATALSEVEAELNVEAIEVFATAVGGRRQLADTLAVAGSGAVGEKITTLLLDPRYAQWSLSRLCATAGITVADLFASYRKAMIARAHIEATHIIARKLPPIVDDVMTRAAPQRLVCSKCLGTSAAGQGPCPTCQSTGYTQTEPELDRQKLALELGHLLEKKGGLIVQQNTLAAAGASFGGTGPGALETLQQAVGELLFSGRRPADVDAVRERPLADLTEEALTDVDDPLDDPADDPADAPAGDAPPPPAPEP